MTDIVLFRHGETVWHAENRYAGVSDIDLTPSRPGAGGPAGRLGANRAAGRGVELHSEPRPGRRPEPARTPSACRCGVDPGCANWTSVQARA